MDAQREGQEDGFLQGGCLVGVGRLAGRGEGEDVEVGGGDVRVAEFGPPGEGGPDGEGVGGWGVGEEGGCVEEVGEEGRGGGD